MAQYLGSMGFVFFDCLISHDPFNIYLLPSPTRWFHFLVSSRLSSAAFGNTGCYAHGIDGCQLGFCFFFFLRITISIEIGNIDLGK